MDNRPFKCPHCGWQMIDDNSEKLLATMPPKVWLECYGCKQWVPICLRSEE